jgi:methyl-accepting chemotaxis protein
VTNLITKIHIKDEYETIFQQCVSLNTELHKLVPLAKQMHLLSANAVSSAARAGSEGDAFRVLTQDIQLLGDDVSRCITDTQEVIADIVNLASRLAQLIATYSTFNDLLNRFEPAQAKTSVSFFEEGINHVITEIQNNNIKLNKELNALNLLLEPVTILVKKGEYLAVCSAVEAARAGEFGVSFESVAAMLKELVGQLDKQSKLQQSILRDLSEAMESQQIMQRNLLYAR